MLTNLVSCYPQFSFRNKKIVSLGWTGGLLSHYLAKDNSISESIARIPPGEEFAKLFVRAADFCSHNSDSGMGAVRSCIGLSINKSDR